jgi:hypothetical protein
MERVKGTVLGIVLFGLLLAGPAAAKDERIVLDLAEFLPRATTVFVTLPNARLLERVLAHTGEKRRALATRLVKGTDLTVDSVSTVFELLVAAADGPVTYSRHVVNLPARPGIPATSARPFLITAATRRKGDHLDVTARDLVRDFLAPRYAKQAKDEQLMGFPALHLSGKGRDLYVATGRGHLFISSSPLILGTVLKEMQSPTGRTLAHVPAYAAAKQAVASRADGEHGFLYVSDPTLLPLGSILGGRAAFGLLQATENGFRDEVTVTLDESSVLSGLAADAKAPAGWSRAGGDGVWFGAVLAPAAVETLAANALQPWNADAARGISDVAAGPVEGLLTPGRAPLFRILLKADADPGNVGETFPSVGRIVGRTLIFSEDPKRRIGAPEAVEVQAGTPFLLKTSRGRLLAALGVAGAPAGSATALSGTPGSGGITLTSGGAEVGPFALVVALLFR